MVEQPVSNVTLTGAKLWIIVGLLIFTGVLALIGVCVPESRTYAVKCVEWAQTMVSTIASMR